MKKQVVFLHQNYPSQFGPISQFLLKEYDVDVTFFTEYISKPIHPGIQHYQYKSVQTGHENNPYFFSRYFEQECASMHGLYNALQQSKLQPDVLIGHVAFGNLGLLHVEYPNIPRIGFFELFYDPYRKHSDHRSEYPVPKPNQIRIPLRNATQLVELEYCTMGYSPTHFQKSTYPKAYQDKLSVLFDGINTELYQPDEVTNQSELKRTWPVNAPIVTYVSRGLEAMRGFDIFMEVAHKVSLIRQDVHFVIAGNPRTHYGSEMISIQEPTFKDYVLKRFPYDLNRFHFLDWISEPALVVLFRLSACHFYWTVPFTLSWSLFQAMATGVIALVSDSEPTRDIVFHGETGLLVKPNDIDGFVDQMLDILDRPAAYRPICEAARELMVKNYSFEVCLPQLAEFYLGQSHDISSKMTGRIKNHAHVG